MNSDFYPVQGAHGRPAQRWLIGGGALLVVTAALVSTVVAERQAAQPVAPPAAVRVPASTVPPIEADAVQGPGEYMDGYAIVDGQVMIRLSSRVAADVTSRLVALEDGYYDEGPQGYEWRLRPGR